MLTGASIRAAKLEGRHIVALEADSDIFKELLQPLQISAEPLPGTGAPQIDIDDDDETPLPDEEKIDYCE